MRAPLLSRSHRRRVSGDEIVLDLDERFNTDEAAPIATPRSTEPGQQTLTLVDIESVMPISGGVLDVGDQVTSPVWGEEGGYGEALVREAGRALMLTVNGVALSGNSAIGWNDAGDLGPAWNHLEHAIRGVSGAIAVGSTSVVAFTSQTGVDLKYLFLLRAAGCHYFVKGGTYPEWSRRWVDNALSDTPLYPVWTNYDGDFTLDDLRSALLDSPWDNENADATQVLAGARSAGDTFNHEKDCLIEAEIATIPAAGQIEIRFRIQDANNYLQVTVDSAGDLDLDKVIGGTPTQLDSAAAVIANSDRIMIVCDDDDISVYEANVARLTGTEATLKNETAGELETEGTGGAVTDIISWPMCPSGRALDEIIKLENTR